MKKFGLMVAMMAAALLAFSCAPKATPDDCKKACDKKATFETYKPDEALVKAQTDAAKKVMEVSKEKSDALAKVDEKFAEKTKKAGEIKDAKKKEAEQKKLGEEINKEKEPIEKDFEGKIKAAQEGVTNAKKALDEAQKKFEDGKKKNAESCVADCAKGWKKKVAECKAGAANADAWNACK